MHRLTGVAAGDFNLDGTDETVLATTQAVVVRDGKTHAVLRTLTLGRGFGTVRVAAGDVTGDGRPTS